MVGFAGYLVSLPFPVGASVSGRLYIGALFLNLSVLRFGTESAE